LASCQDNLRAYEIFSTARVLIIRKWKQIAAISIAYGAAGAFPFRWSILGQGAYASSFMFVLAAILKQ